MPQKPMESEQQKQESLSAIRTQSDMSVRELSLKTDDLLLIGLIILLLPNAKDNLLLILVLGYLLIAGIN